MNLAALLLIAAALVVLLFLFWPVPLRRPRNLWALVAALLVLAVVAQLVWTSAHQFTF
jgi:multisubunit Na+/H+ antiporter MnhB subunit